MRLSVPELCRSNFRGRGKGPRPLHSRRQGDRAAAERADGGGASGGAGSGEPGAAGDAGAGGPGPRLGCADGGAARRCCAAQRRRVGKGHPPCRLRPCCERAFLRGRRQPRRPARKLPADRRCHPRSAEGARRGRIRLPRRHAADPRGSAERGVRYRAPVRRGDRGAGLARPRSRRVEPPPGVGRGLSRRRARRRRFARPLDRFSLGAPAGSGIAVGARPAAAAALFDRVFAKAGRQRRAPDRVRRALATARPSAHRDCLGISRRTRAAGCRWSRSLCSRGAISACRPMARYRSS